MTEPEVRLAQRLVERRGLAPPIDVHALLSEYANVEFVDFPVEVDGLSLGLKGKEKPTVLVNRKASRLRQRFTLAHELGHVLIPWHIGNIIDEIDLKSSDIDYYLIEAEANRFASELLMPTKWTVDLISVNENKLDVLFELAERSGVSLQAALIKFVACLAPRYVIAQSMNNIVTWSARSKGTLAGIVPKDTDLSLIDPFPFTCVKWQKYHGTNAVSKWNLWYFAFDERPIKKDVPRPWREILDQITLEIVASDAERLKLKSSVSGVTASANSATRLHRNVGNIVSAILQRLHTRALADLNYRKFVEHPLLQDFCIARAEMFIDKQ